ncbi:MAG: hypothetical protein AAGA90_18890 [Actinomycetota bacterium]
MSLTRIGRRAVVIATASLTLVVGLITPASAGTGPGSAPYLAKDDTASAELGLDGLDDGLDPIALHCRGEIGDDGAVAGCRWRTASTEVATFQLWRLELRVDDAARVLVAEVGADTTSAVDTGVTAGSAYLYAVLGLDDSGEIVARSRVDRVRFRDPSIEHLRLDCDKSDAGSTGDAADGDVVPAIGCTWIAADDSGVRAYQLYRSTHGGERVLVATLGADATGYVDTGVEAGVRYLYRVEGVDAAGTTVARSRLDGAGCPKRDRDDRDERREQRKEERADRRDGVTRGDADDVADTTDDGAEETDDTLVAVTESDATDADRDDHDTRPDRDRRDRRERGR